MIATSNFHFFCRYKLRSHRSVGFVFGILNWTDQASPFLRFWVSNKVPCSCYPIVSFVPIKALSVQAWLTKAKRPHIVLNTLPLPFRHHIRLVLQSNVFELRGVEPIPSSTMHFSMRPCGQMVDGFPISYPDHSIAAIVISCYQRGCLTKD